MEYTPEIELLTPNSALKMPARWDERLARGISNVLSPPLIAVIGIAVLSTLIDTLSSWWWLGYYLVLAVVFPVAYLSWKVYHGEISDFHVREREQRIRPMTLALACSITALGSLWAGQAPRLLQIFSTLSVLQIALLLLITLRWKISGHGAAISSLAIILWGLYGSDAVPALLAIPLVAWARIHLHRHSLAQIIAGSLVGGMFALSVLILLPLAQ
jgi:membrane-associated phospholipid phosphatase